MLNLPVKIWIRIVLLDLMIVAALGALMRYKIAFEFPFFDQKYLQFAHSHFAFSGWVTQSILILTVHLIGPFLSTIQLKKYNYILWINFFSATGMLLSFMFLGYHPISIFFSTISIILVFVFAYLFYSMLKQFRAYHQAIKWFVAALFFAMLSTCGTIALTYMMASHHIHQHIYLASIYFYLHFQYNGWFLFSCVALFVAQANKKGILIKQNKTIFILMAGSCLPAYFLSMLWAHLPVWLYSIVLLATISQLAGWIILLKNVFSVIKSALRLTRLSFILVYFVAIAGTVKYLLQLGSTIPHLSNLAFGFRPVVIAYLHLVLLAIISVSLILYMFSSTLLSGTLKSKCAIILFISAVLMNEIALAIQGVAAFGYIIVPHINIVLLVIAILLFVSVLLMLITQFKGREV